MLYLIKTDISQRWDTVPEILREAITSEANSDFIWKTCESEHILDKNIFIVSKIISYALLGFIHPGDLAEEIADELKINKKIADSIASAINTRIFSPLTSELNSAYEPPSKFDTSSAPQMLDEIKRPPMTPVPPPTLAASSIPKPPSPSIPTPSIAPKPAPAPTPAPAGFAQTPRPMTDFSKSVPMPSSVTPTPAPFAKIPSQARDDGKITNDGNVASEAPQILQEETQFKPLRQQSGFGISISMPKSINATADKEKIPMKPAILEFGSTPAAPKTTGDAPKAPRVVHYSEFRSQLTPGTIPDKAQEQTRLTPTQQGATTLPIQPPDSHTREEITAMPSSAPTPPTQYGSMARPMPAPAAMPTIPNIPTPMGNMKIPDQARDDGRAPNVLMEKQTLPPAPFPPVNIPKAPTANFQDIPHPKMSDVFLEEKDLPHPLPQTPQNTVPPVQRPPMNPVRIPPTPPPIPPRPPKI